jgi:hypothetical protein
MWLEGSLKLAKSVRHPFVGVGLLVVAAAYFVSSLRPQISELVKGSVKLYLEAELDADSELTDRLVDTSVDALMRIVPHGTEVERQRHADHELDRFFSKARAAAHRRGFNSRGRERKVPQASLQDGERPQIPATAYQARA